MDAIRGKAARCYQRQQQVCYNRKVSNNRVLLVFFCAISPSEPKAHKPTNNNQKKVRNKKVLSKKKKLSYFVTGH